MSHAAPHRPMPFITRVRVENYKSIAQRIPAGSETLRDCKRWLTHHRRDGVRYRPRVDQAALADGVDLDLGRVSSPSFDKFCRDVTYLITGKRGE